MAIVLLEELLRRGVPVLAIDPKGDLGNLLLLFERLDAASFEPWIDAEAARRDGKDVPTAARDTAERWKKGLAEWGIGPEDIAALKKTHDAVVYTPGSTRGSAPQRAPVPRGALGSLRVGGGGPAGRDRGDRGRTPRPPPDRRRPAPVPRGHPPLEPDRARLAGGPGLRSRDPDRRGGRPAVREARGAAGRDGLPGPGPPGAHARPQQPPGRALVPDLARGPAAGRRAAPLHPGEAPPALGHPHRPPPRRGAALRDRAAPRQGQDLDAPPGRDQRAAGPRLHGRGLRLLPAPPRQPADQAAPADAAQAGPGPGRGGGPRHPEPGGPRLQGPVEHGHLDGGDAADRPGPGPPRRRAHRRRPRQGRGETPPRGHPQAGVPPPRRAPRRAVPRSLALGHVVPARAPSPARRSPG